MSNSTLGFSFHYGNAPENITIPFKIIVLSGFSGNTESKIIPSQKVTKENVNDVISKFNASLDIDVENVLSHSQARLKVKLEFTTLKDFNPHLLIDKIPALLEIRHFIQLVSDFRQKKLSPQAFSDELCKINPSDALQAAIQMCQKTSSNSNDSSTAVNKQTIPNAKPEKKPADSTSIDRILDMVETSDPIENSTANIAKNGIQHVLSHITGAGSHTKIGNEINHAVSIAQQSLDKQLTLILQHPQFQQLEESWRGIRFLIEHTDFRDPIVIELLDCAKVDLIEKSNNFVFEPSHNGQLNTPVGLMLLNFDFTHDDTELLKQMAQRADANQIPILFSFAKEFIGLNGAQDSIPFIGTRMEKPEFNSWNALCEKDYSRWLAGGFNPFLLRHPYTPETTRNLEFNEHITNANDLLWGHAGWIICSLICKSISATGWPTEINRLNSNHVDGLELHLTSPAHGEPMQIPLYIPLPTQTVEDMTKFGIIPVVCRPNRDSAFVYSIPVIHKPPKFQQDPVIHTDLGYQLLVARIVQFLNVTRSKYVIYKEAPEIKQHLESLLLQLLSNTGPGMHFDTQITPKADDPNRFCIDVMVRTGRHILGGREVTLSFET